MGFDPADLGIARGNVKDTLIYSLWMAFLCTLICLVMATPAALSMADRNFKRQHPGRVVHHPHVDELLLRTIAWMSLLEDNGLINTLLGALGLPRMPMYNSRAVLLGMVYNHHALYGLLL